MVPSRTSLVLLTMGIAAFGFVGRLREGHQRSPALPLNTLTETERAAGWSMLFDGKTIDQWRGYGERAVPPSWKIVDGTLARVADGPDLTTKSEYTDFELALDWRISPGGNSGIMYRVTESADPPYYTGPEMQILDNAKHEDGKLPETSAGSNFALYAPLKDMTWPVGEWNAARILVQGNHVEHWLNGAKVVTYELGSADWKARVAKSKFNDWKGYGTARTGHIVLQNHGADVWFRNIKIRKLS